VLLPAPFFNRLPLAEAQQPIDRFIAVKLLRSAIGYIRPVEFAVAAAQELETTWCNRYR